MDGIRVIQNGVVRFSRDFPRSYEGVYPMTDRSGPFNYHDARWHPYHTGSARHTLQSVTKSVTSLVYGIAIARGDIKRIDAPIATYLPSYSGAFDDARKKRITIRHLLAMTSSIRWPEGGAYALRINVRRNRISVNRTRDLLYRRPWPGERTAIALGRSGRHVPPASTTSHLSTHASSSCRSLCRNA